MSNHVEGEKRTRLTLDKDGFTTMPQEDFQTFVKYPSWFGGAYHIYIPKQIERVLQLTSETILQVAIKPITREESLATFNGLPIKTSRRQSLSPYDIPLLQFGFFWKLIDPKTSPKHIAIWDTKKYALSPLPQVGGYVECPVCHKLGLTRINKCIHKYRCNNKTYISSTIQFYIKHYDDGIITCHYIAKGRFPDFWLLNVKQRFPEAVGVRVQDAQTEAVKA